MANGGVMPKVGVILSGCGVYDGTEIHEAVLTLLALDRAGAEVQCVAPDLGQSKVVNHLYGNEVKETRNVLVESARIARGQILDLDDLDINDLDALIFPGGFGAALNLCDFGMRGAECEIYPGIEELLQKLIQAKKPIGVFCIAPVLLARAVNKLGLNVQLTIGNDPDTAAQLEMLNCTHIEAKASEIVVDKVNKIVSTPAYMLATSISEVAAGIEAAVQKIITLI